MDSSQALGIARFKSSALVDNKMMVVIWTKREVYVRRSRLVFEARKR